MSTLSKLYEAEDQDLEQAIDRVESLGIDVNLVQAANLYLRLSALGQYSDISITPPGVKGFDLALKTSLIMTGVENPQPHIELDTNDQSDTRVVSRPFNILLNSTDSPLDYGLAKATQRGYRLGLYILCNLSPQIDYLDSNVKLGESRIIARHAESDTFLQGTHISRQICEENEFDLGYGGKGIFPGNAEQVYSYAIMRRAE